jgi:hypothetical protein
MNCPICLRKGAARIALSNTDGYEYECKECGKFELTHEALINLGKVDDSVRWKVSAWVNEYQSSPLTAAILEQALDCRTPSIHHRADRMLRWLVARFPAGKLFSINDLGDIEWGKDEFIMVSHMTACRLTPIGWNRSPDEVTFMVTEVLCNELGLLISQNNHDYQVSPKGFLYLEGRGDRPTNIGFCAMWFNASMDILWEKVIHKAIAASGYEPLIIRDREHNGKIDDAIVAAIRTARFVVADYTGHRGGVYYEAGFAHGLGIPVIFMCRQDALQDLHFDVRQYNCIVWSPDDLPTAQMQLQNRIRATLGQGHLNVAE